MPFQSAFTLFGKLALHCKTKRKGLIRATKSNTKLKHCAEVYDIFENHLFKKGFYLVYFWNNLDCVSLRGHTITKELIFK